MNLKIMLPLGVFSDVSNVTSIVAESIDGYFGLLPQRLDCVAVLVPGILVYRATGPSEVFVALDEGILVKTASEVRISVRRAYTGTDLEKLQGTVEHDFLELDQQEERLRALTTKLETGFLRRLLDFAK